MLLVIRSGLLPGMDTRLSTRETIKTPSTHCENHSPLACPRVSGPPLCSELSHPEFPYFPGMRLRFCRNRDSCIPLFCLGLGSLSQSLGAAGACKRWLRSPLQGTVLAPSCLSTPVFLNRTYSCHRSGWALLASFLTTSCHQNTLLLSLLSFL